MLNKLFDIEYINKYINDIYDVYGAERYGITTTYYSIDFEHSKNLDKSQYFDAGAYSDFGGLFSGWKWNKINFVPLFGFDQINGRVNVEEDGINFKTVTNAKLPSKIGIRPFFNDIILVNEYTGNSPITYIISGMEGSGMGDKSDHLLALYYIDIDINMIKNCIVEEYIYVPFFRKIYQKDLAIRLLDNIEKLENLNEDIYKLDNRISGLNCIEV